MLVYWIALVAPLCVYTVSADIVCATSGHTGCSVSCALSRRGEGICEENPQDKAYHCRCYIKDPLVDLFTQQQSSHPQEANQQKETETGDASSQSTREIETTQGLPWFAKQMIFFPVVRSGLFGLFKDLSDPSTYNLDNAINYRIPSENGTLGAWHIWPQGSEKTALWDLEANDTIIVYMHGNSATRGFNHRVQLYKLLSDLGFHIVSFDYRGFGDSTQVDLSEDTVVEDGVNVLHWVGQQLDVDRRSADELPLVLVWGHSLGTAVSTHSLYRWKQKQEKGVLVSGLVLESPFTNMTEEVKTFALGRFLSSLLAQDTMEILRRGNVQFLSSSYLPQLDAPTLILHAEDDRIVPAKLGEKLYKESMEKGKLNIRFKMYPKDLRLRHRYMYSAPDLDLQIKDLWSQAEEFRRNIL